MKIHADFRQEVTIDPIDVIKKLIDAEMGRDSWVSKDKNKYYIFYDEYYGPRSITIKELISKEKYEYIQHLKCVLNHLENKTK